jgi:hypothetical protein
VIRTSFLQAAGAAVELLGRREVGEKWNEASALEELDIGALAGHLARAVLTVHWYLDMPQPDPPTVTAGEYFATHPSGDIKAEVNVEIRARAVEAAKGGWARVYLDVGNAYDHLRRRIPDASPDHLIPSTGRALVLDEYLRTRVVELVLHIGDLSRSIDVPPPDLGEATKVAIGVLLDTALVRHGPTAVLHALARRELDTMEALRVL